MKEALTHYYFLISFEGHADLFIEFKFVFGENIYGYKNKQFVIRKKSENQSAAEKEDEIKQKFKSHQVKTNRYLPDRTGRMMVMNYDS
jgi:hypothetical protein